MKNFKSGMKINQGYYRSFQPDFINRQWHIDNIEVLHLLSRADRELGRLDMFSKYIPNVELFISMHVLKEATQSSKIEGTQTNMEDALLEKEDIPLDKRDDWEEVQNYIEAMNAAVQKLEKLPFSSRLMKDAHRILMQGVRGENKQPGEFRQSQNWIGGATINDALFIPPVHHTIAELISDLELFVHNEKIFVPDLIKIALIHYQFETIHPFLDGNGRVGRLMITLYLVDKEILKKPILYLSDFFEKNRSNYYDNLTKAREKNDITQWLKFFLVGVIQTAQKGVETFDGILQLQKKVEAQIYSLGSRYSKAQTILNYLYQKPIIDAQKISEICDISMKSVYILIKEFERFEILKEITGSKRGRLYVFDEYLKLYN